MPHLLLFACWLEFLTWVVIAPSKNFHHSNTARDEGVDGSFTMLDMLPYLRVLPWVAVETAPATVWSMYHEKEGSVHPSGCFTVLHAASLACQVRLPCGRASALVLACLSNSGIAHPGVTSSDTGSQMPYKVLATLQV